MSSQRIILALSNGLTQTLNLKNAAALSRTPRCIQTEFPQNDADPKRTSFQHRISCFLYFLQPIPPNLPIPHPHRRPILVQIPQNPNRCRRRNAETVVQVDFANQSVLPEIIQYKQPPKNHINRREHKLDEDRELPGVVRSVDRVVILPLPVQSFGLSSMLRPYYTISTIKNQWTAGGL